MLPVAVRAPAAARSGCQQEVPCVVIPTPRIAVYGSGVWNVTGGRSDVARCCASSCCSTLRMSASGSMRSDPHTTDCCVRGRCGMSPGGGVMLPVAVRAPAAARSGCQQVVPCVVIPTPRIAVYGAGVECHRGAE